MPRFTPCLLLAAGMAVVSAPPSAAQTVEPTVPGNEHVAPKLDPKACRDRDRLQRGDVVENEGAAPHEEGNPSDKLARTEGVICPPPELDPDIRAPAPKNGGNMPVIPPPGSPGGAPSTRPK
jgi:hypothetical protein